ncbi:MAG TPA: NotI family restriction endonuclease [Anaerolineae bacterium]|nr:NotI family restriction endonuclease [Anaerolineae bacterium]HQI85565.1 NotI family restriction endonuclease [Anaerolineae bacterium]
MNKVLELYTISTHAQADWNTLVTRQQCAYLDRKCLKTRKSAPDVSIGTCTVNYGRGEPKPLIICPFRLLERRQVFMDCLHLLTLHEPGNELHIVQEVPIPGGSVDYFLVSAKARQVKDFVGLELQTLDTTGTVWPERQRFLQEQGLEVDTNISNSAKSFGMNWKITAKTTLMQLHHEAQTFEHLNKHLVLVIQDHLLNYMRRAFRFEHLNQARLGDPIHIHPYTLSPTESEFRLSLGSRFSTDVAGIAECLGLQANPKIELREITRFLESKISDTTLLTVK